MEARGRWRRGNVGADLGVRPGGEWGVGEFWILDFGIPSWEGQGWVSSILDFGFLPLRAGCALRSSFFYFRSSDRANPWVRYQEGWADFWWD